MDKNTRLRNYKKALIAIEQGKASFICSSLEVYQRMDTPFRYSTILGTYPELKAIKPKRVAGSLPWWPLGYSATRIAALKCIIERMEGVSLNKRNIKKRKSFYEAYLKLKSTTLSLLEHLYLKGEVVNGGGFLENYPELFYYINHNNTKEVEFTKPDREVVSLALRRLNRNIIK